MSSGLPPNEVDFSQRVAISTRPKATISKTSSSKIENCKPTPIFPLSDSSVNLRGGDLSHPRCHSCRRAQLRCQCLARLRYLQLNIDEEDIDFSDDAENLDFEDGEDTDPIEDYGNPNVEVEDSPTIGPTPHIPAGEESSASDAPAEQGPTYVSAMASLRFSPLRFSIVDEGRRLTNNSVLSAMDALRPMFHLIETDTPAPSGADLLGFEALQLSSRSATGHESTGVDGNELAPISRVLLTHSDAMQSNSIDSNDTNTSSQAMRLEAFANFTEGRDNQSHQDSTSHGPALAAPESQIEVFNTAYSTEDGVVSTNVTVEDEEISSLSTDIHRSPIN
jgi:hypothetical protein